MAAQALVAGARTVEAPLVVHSLHSYFLRPGDTAVPIMYDVERMRDGRSFVTRRVVARQHGRPIYCQTSTSSGPRTASTTRTGCPTCRPRGASVGELVGRAAGG